MPWRTTNKSIGTSVDSLVTGNPARTSLRIFNNSANALYVFPDREQGTTNGYPVPKGTSIELSTKDGDDVNGEWLAVADGSSSDIRIMEHFKPLDSRTEK